MMHDPGLAHQTQFSFPSLFCTMEPEPVQPGMLINVCKYLDSLQYRVWKKMVMSVETGEFGAWAGGTGMRGTPCKAESSLNSLSPASLRQGPAPCSSSIPCPTAQKPLSKTPSSLGPDPWPPLEKKKLTSLCSELDCVYKIFLSSELPLSR